VAIRRALNRSTGLFSLVLACLRDARGRDWRAEPSKQLMTTRTARLVIDGSSLSMLVMSINKQGGVAVMLTTPISVLLFGSLHATACLSMLAPEDSRYMLL
jgi:hypothetical protein